MLPSRRCWIASLVFVLACGGAPQLGYPRLTIESTGIGDEGGQMSFSIDAGGQFHRESRGDIGNGTIAWTRCDGSLPVEDVSAVLAEFDRGRLDGDRKQFGTPSNPRERTTLTYQPSSTETRFPVDDAEHARLEALVMKLHHRALSSDAKCEESREK